MTAVYIILAFFAVLIALNIGDFGRID